MRSAAAANAPTSDTAGFQSAAATGRPPWGGSDALNERQRGEGGGGLARHDDGVGTADLHGSDATRVRRAVNALAALQISSGGAHGGLSSSMLLRVPHAGRRAAAKDGDAGKRRKAGRRREVA